MATLDRIRVHPVKALDPVDRDRVRISAAGGLEGDRVLAIRDAEGRYVNGKLTPAVHRLHVDVDLDARTVAIGQRGTETPASFHLDSERAELEAWLGEYFGLEVSVEEADGGLLADSPVLGGDDPGATIVSTSTLEAVASWFPGIDVESVRRRFRANLEVGGAEPFWEDGLVDDGAAFRIGDVAFSGPRPVTRCVVPTRDPDTGTPTPGFQERFVEQRKATLPDWADAAAFDHFYALTTMAYPSSDACGEAIAVGDRIESID